MDCSSAWFCPSSAMSTRVRNRLLARSQRCARLAMRDSTAERVAMAGVKRRSQEHAEPLVVLHPLLAQF